MCVCVCVSNMEGIYFVPCICIFYYVSKWHTLTACPKEVFVTELIIINGHVQDGQNKFFFEGMRWERRARASWAIDLKFDMNGLNQRGCGLAWAWEYDIPNHRGWCIILEIQTGQRYISNEVGNMNYYYYEVTYNILKCEVDTMLRPIEYFHLHRSTS